MYYAIVLKDNGVNESVSQWLAESCREWCKVVLNHHPQDLTNKSQEKEVSSESSMLSYLATKRKMGECKVWDGSVRNKINVLGISGTRWPGEEEDCKSDGFRIFHLWEENQQGVAIILDKRTANCVEKIRYKGDRLLMVKLKGKPVDMLVDMCIIQVYMPTMERSEEVDDWYVWEDRTALRWDQRQGLYCSHGIFQLLYEKVKRMHYVGHYGFRYCNDRGQILDFFLQMKTDVYRCIPFTQDRRSRYTWTKPGDTVRYIYRVRQNKVAP